MRHLTRAYRDRVTIPPTCRTAWEKFLGLGELPFHLIWQQLAHPLLTNRDRKNRLRIVNRSLRTRSWATKGAPCRLRCGCGEDRLSHLHACPEIQSLFSCIEDPPSPQLIYLGLQRDLRPLTGGLSMLYTLIWKFALIAYTRADTDGEPFDQATISRSAVRRLSTRLEACSAEAKAMVERYRSRGEEVPEQALARLRKKIGPDITLSDSGAR